MPCLLCCVPCTVQVVNSSSTFKGKPLIMKWYSPKPKPAAPTLSTVSSSSSSSSLPHQPATPTALERQPSEVRGALFGVV